MTASILYYVWLLYEDSVHFITWEKWVGDSKFAKNYLMKYSELRAENLAKWSLYLCRLMVLTYSININFFKLRKLIGDWDHPTNLNPNPNPNPNPTRTLTLTFI